MLTVESLTVALPPGGDRPNAVQEVSFTLAPGEFVQAAEVLGRSRLSIMLRDILPNALSPSSCWPR